MWYPRAKHLNALKTENVQIPGHPTKSRIARKILNKTSPTQIRKSSQTKGADWKVQQYQNSKDVKFKNKQEKAKKRKSIVPNTMLRNRTGVNVATLEKTKYISLSAHVE